MGFLVTAQTASSGLTKKPWQSPNGALARGIPTTKQELAGERQPCRTTDRQPSRRDGARQVDTYRRTQTRSQSPTCLSGTEDRDGLHSGQLDHPAWCWYGELTTSTNAPQPDAEHMTQPAPTLGVTALITTYCGYAYMLVGAACGANALFDVGIGYKGFVFPADWRLALARDFWWAVHRRLGAHSRRRLVPGVEQTSPVGAVGRVDVGGDPRVCCDRRGGVLGAYWVGETIWV